MSNNQKRTAEELAKEYLTLNGYSEKKVTERTADVALQAMVVRLKQENVFEELDTLLPFKGETTYYEQQYNQLAVWVEHSLDCYRAGLSRILFPLLVHSYLDLLEENQQEIAVRFLKTFQGRLTEKHQSELSALGAVISKAQVKENQLAQLFRKNMYVVYLSKYSSGLLMSFIREKELNFILQLLNKFVSIRIMADDSIENASGLPGLDEQKEKATQPAVLWGPLNPPRISEQDITAFWYHEPIYNKTNARAPTTVPLVPTDSSPALDRVPLPEARKGDIECEIQRLNDLSRTLQSPSICCYTVHTAGSSLSSFSFSSDVQLAAGGFEDSHITLWSLNRERPLPSLRPSTELAAINLTEAPSLEELFEDKRPLQQKLVGHHGCVYAVDFFEDKQFLLSASQDATVRLWSLHTFSTVAIYKGHQHPIWDMKLGPHEYYFATASADRTARLWCTERKEALRIFQGHLSDVDCLSFHPNSNYLATGSSDKTVRLWDLQSGRSVRLFTGPKQNILACTTSPCGRYLACSSSDLSVSVWDIADGRCVYTNSQLSSKKIYTLAFNPSGEILSAASSSGELFIIKFLETRILNNYTAKNLCHYTLSYVNQNLLVTGGCLLDLK